jgi:hypothetical protein
LGEEKPEEELKGNNVASFNIMSGIALFYTLFYERMSCLILYNSCQKFYTGQVMVFI